MTDKAPARIWAWEYKGHTPWGPIKPDLDVVTNGAEYVRADFHQTLMTAHDTLEKTCIAQDDKLQALKAERDKLKEWQPIETLPPHWKRDGVSILIYCPFFYVRQSHFEGGCWQVNEWRKAKTPAPTHWMPLPEPPALGETEK